MQEPEMPDDEFKIPLKDILNAVRKSRKRITLFTLASAFLFAGFSLFKPILYLGEATFKEKSNSHASTNSNNLASFLLSGLSAGSQSDARTMMTSRKLMEEIVKTLNMQAVIVEAGTSEGLLIRPFRNLEVEYNIFRKKEVPPLKDRSYAVRASQIAYSGELPLSYSILFDSEDTFQLSNKEQNLGTGSLGTSFITGECAFTLSKANASELKGKTFSLTFLPLPETAKGLADSIKVSLDKVDSCLLKLSYKNRDRHVACEVINQLMASYQNYLRSEQEKISSEQINYLNKREREIGANLDSMIQDYANRVSSDLSTVGYINSEKGLDFLASQLQGYKEKTLLTDLILKRLTRVLEEDPKTQLDAFLQGGQKSEYFDQLVSTILQLKQESERMELAIRERGCEKREEWQTCFEKQMAEIGEMRASVKETTQLIAELEKGRVPAPPTSLEDKKYMITPWIEQLQEIESGWKKSSHAEEKEKKREEWLHVREQFVAYLNNLQHHLEIRERSIRERVSHQQTPQGDFQGINLETANKLYLSYIQQQSELESQILQYHFLLDELKNPNLEISSLSSLVTDEVTKKLIDSASKLVLSLQDDANRSAKEKERMKAELEFERKFLTIHLKQTIDLLTLNIGLIKEKIYTVQNATLELLHQQTTLLEKQLADSIRTHIRNMREERKLIVSNERELKQEMASLPQKWAAEKMIEQKLKLNATMVEEVAKLVESKNIASNLEIIQSAPIDKAIPKVYPERTSLILFTLIGGLLGAILATAATIASGILKGFPASKECLELAGVHVSGSISHQKDSNRRTLKNLKRFLNSKAKLARTGNESESHGMAFLLAGERKFFEEEELFFSAFKEQQEKTLFLREGREETPPQWLFGKVEDFPISSHTNCSELSLEIPLVDLLTYLNFQQLQKIFQDLKARYRFVIAESQGRLEDLKEIISFVDCAAIQLSESQPMATLKPFIQTLKEEGKTPVTTFIIMED